jgi:transposase-like protein
VERRQFTRDFKLEAVRLIKHRGVSYAQALKDLGVHAHYRLAQKEPTWFAD